MQPGVIDVHTHCFAGPNDAAAVAGGLARLRAAGVRHLGVIGLVNPVLGREAARRLLPASVDHRGDPDLDEARDLLSFARTHAPAIVPFVDTRQLWGDVPALLDDCMARGFRGIKGIYLPDDRNDIGVRGVPETLGITLDQYRRREWEIFAFAQARDLPVVYHLDARRHGDVLEAMLREFPRLRIDLAHFGIGRRAFSPFLDRFPNLYTDTASLLPHLRRDPDGYRAFLCRYADRVCFGTDAFLYGLDEVLAYLDGVRGLGLPPEVERAVLWHNPRRFLGGAVAGADRPGRGGRDDAGPG